MIDTTIASLTLERFAALRPCWPEYLCGMGGDGILIARIHPCNNRPVGDEDVLARALVCLPKGGIDGGHLARLTIRTTNIRMTDDDPFSVDVSRWYTDMYIKTLQAILALPVIELS